MGGILTTDDGMYRMGVWERRNAARPALGSWLNVVIEVLVLPATPPTGLLGDTLQTVPILCGNKRARASVKCVNPTPGKRIAAVGAA